MRASALRGSSLPLVSEALATKNGAVLRGPEGNRRLLAALRTHCGRFDTRVSRALRRTDSGQPAGLARLATFGFVTELLIVEEKLFACGEDEIATAIYALQGPILELHASSWLQCLRGNTNAQHVFSPPDWTATLGSGPTAPGSVRLTWTVTRRSATK